MKKYIGIVLVAVFAALLGTSTCLAPAEPPIVYSEEKTILPEYPELYAQDADMAYPYMKYIILVHGIFTRIFSGTSVLCDKMKLQSKLAAIDFCKKGEQENTEKK